MSEITLKKFNNIKMCFNTDKFRVRNAFRLQINTICTNNRKNDGIMFIKITCLCVYIYFVKIRHKIQ